ncbi:MAG: hypothetical protein KDA96_27640, partial [Planctomycetaceae bacterium]|nr:hypothetical protein [Planctomycetaceae bacterium]
MKLISAAGELVVFRQQDNAEGLLSRYDLTADMPTLISEQSFSGSPGTLLDNTTIPGLLFAGTARLMLMDAADPFRYVLMIGHPFASEVPLVATDESTHSLLSVFSMKEGPFLTQSTRLFLGPQIVDLEDELPEAIAVWPAGPRRYLVSSDSQQWIVDVTAACNHWPFDFESQQRWESAEDQPTAIIPESPEKLTQNKQDSLATLKAGHDIAKWAEDGGSWVSFQRVGSVVNFHRFDRESLTETHRLTIPGADRSMGVFACPAGVMVVSPGKRRVELFSTDDLHVIWAFEDDDLQQIRCSPYHDQIAVTTDVDFTIMDARTGSIQHRISRAELLLHPETRGLFGCSLLVTTDPELFYLGKSGNSVKESDLIGPIRVTDRKLTFVERPSTSILQNVRQPTEIEYRIDNRGILTVLDDTGKVLQTIRFTSSIRQVAPNPASPGEALISVGPTLMLLQRKPAESQ